MPDGLATKTQLGAIGMKPAPGPPDAVVDNSKKVFALYCRSKAIAKKPATTAQRDALERGRASQAAEREAHRCQACQHIDASVSENAERIFATCHWRVHARRQQQAESAERLEQLAAAQDWAVIDLETTGLKTDSRIVEIAIVARSGAVLLNTRINPLAPIPPEAAAIHGTGDADVNGAPAWHQVTPTIEPLLQRHGVRRFVAFNAEFDATIFAYECHRVGAPDLAMWWTCVMQDLSAACESPERWLSLTDVCSSLGVVPGHHCAVRDANAVLECLRCFATQHDQAEAQ